MNMQEEFQKLVASGELPIESISARNNAISRIQEINASAWTYGFTGSQSLDPNDIFLGLIKLNEDFLYNLGIYVAAFKTASQKLEDHLPILLAKKDRLIRTDEFGDTINSSWNNYLDDYYNSKIKPYFDGIIDQIPEENFVSFETTKSNFIFWLAMNKNTIQCATHKNLNAYIELNRQEQKGSTLDISGREYESKIASLINSETSWSAELTKATGDQGADLLLTKGPIQIVIQTKYHKASIGNSAVQEAYAAQKHYRADMAFVVSNSGFTKSAEDLAHSTGVKLMTDNHLLEFLK